ncbi:hypothetical protein HDU92_008735 [Lobulomyces angularis]|nr:hypothetical protein HDU92_008735 [Lobulomyces angularis]
MEHQQLVAYIKNIKASNQSLSALILAKQKLERDVSQSLINTRSEILSTKNKILTRKHAILTCLEILDEANMNNDYFLEEDPFHYSINTPKPQFYQNNNINDNELYFNNNLKNSLPDNSNTNISLTDVTTQNNNNNDNIENNFLIKQNLGAFGTSSEEFDQNIEELVMKGFLPVKLFENGIQFNVPYKEWTRNPPPSLVYVICAFYEGKEGVERGIHHFCNKRNVTKKGFVYLIERILHWLNPFRYTNQNPRAEALVRDAIRQVHSTVRMQEEMWKIAKKKFNWTLRSLESWESFNWPNEANEFFESQKIA